MNWESLGKKKIPPGWIQEYKGEKLSQMSHSQPIHSRIRNSTTGDVPWEFFLGEPSVICWVNSAKGLPGKDWSSPVLRWEYRGLSPWETRPVALAWWRFAWTTFCRGSSPVPKPWAANSSAPLALPQVEALGGHKSEHKRAGEERRLFLVIHEVLKSSGSGFQTVSLPASC